MDKDLRGLLVAHLHDSATSREHLAAQLNVSISTLVRWESGESKPSPKNEGRLRRLIASSDAVSSPLFDGGSLSSLSSAREPFYETLTSLRETIHRSGNISSRNEALEELTRLLFAHVMLASKEGQGISGVPTGDGSAERLNDRVQQSFSVYLPKELKAHFDERHLSLRLPKNADNYANELITSFAPLSDPKVLRSFSGHEGTDVLNEVFGQFLSQAFHDEKEFGQYLTPTPVVHFMVSLALNSLGDDAIEVLLDPDRCSEFGYILDPSCGTGSFLSEAARTIYRVVLGTHGEKKAHQWVHNALSNVFAGIDKSDRMLQLALTNLALLGAERANLYAANSLRKTGYDGEITERFAGKTHIVLTNPPFGAEFQGNDLLKYDLPTNWASRIPKSVNSELLFLERYADWLFPGGVLAAIVPDSILFNKGLFSELRKGLSRKFEIVSCTSLPSVTFAAAGTSTKTSVLHLRRVNDSSHERPTFFTICKSVGFSVSSRGAQRKVYETGDNELVNTLKEYTLDASDQAVSGRWRRIRPEEDRWDANFHLGIPTHIADLLEKRVEQFTQVSEICRLSTAKRDPRRSASETFNYVEISDVDPKSNYVSSKSVASEEAPSRARKVIESGDILVSTVRPERRTVGVVPPHLDDAICSTGFAVLRPIDPATSSLAIARLLQSDLASIQLLRNNVGISYPSIDEECILSVLLPVSISGLESLSKKAEEIGKLQNELHGALREFDAEVARSISSSDCPN